MPEQSKNARFNDLQWVLAEAESTGGRTDPGPLSFPPDNEWS